MNLISQKYAAALLPFLVLVITSFQTALSGGIDVVESLQLGGILIGAAVTFIVPLVGGSWAGLLKVAGGVLGAVLAAAVPIALDAWSPESITVLVLAGLNALAVQLGVSIRLDGVQNAVASPDVANEQVYRVDPKAYAIVVPRG